MERRDKSRIDIELTCYVSAARVIARSMRGLTRNVSRTGMLMRWTNTAPAPAIGKKLTVEIELPENSVFGLRAMQCRATVVRVETPEGQDHSVALKIHGMKFVEMTADSRTGSGYTTINDLAAMPTPALPM